MQKDYFKIILLNPSRTGGGNASKNIDRQAGYPTLNV